MKALVSATLVVAFLTLTSRSAFAQETISDAAARQAAHDFASHLGSSAEFGSTAVVEREGGPGSQQRPIVRVSDGEIMITLDTSGSFLAYHDLSSEVTKPLDGLKRYETYEEAWSALQRLVRPLNPPPDLLRKSYEFTARGATTPPVLTFLMLPSPYGYVAEGGNILHARLHAVTGKVLGIEIGRNWNYEPPNIRITSQTAIETAIATLGGLPIEWSSTLTYETANRPDSPRAIRDLNAQRTMRLCYNVSSTWGNVIVDSVTGEVVRSERALGTDGKPLVPTLPTMPSGRPPSEVFTMRNIALGSALAALGITIFLLFRHRR